MDFLTISELFLMLCLIVYMLANVKIAARRTIGSALAGVAGFTIALTGIDFCRDIAFAILILSPVGTIAVSYVLGGGDL